ncbi:cytochrome P450 2C20-like [Hemicordylus capensis]|uniref:cytochrome P450 2C20-like n=1 Tax=Hemicordylus capensis TaxID=884348 RepID=UPI00230471E6|nr:cytochrome P450 2C20-like [Hemicordylus capensis]
MGLLGAVPLLLLSCTTFFLALLWRSHRSRRKLPPGPTPLPFVGNMLQVDVRDLVESFQRLQQRYGPVFTIHMGSRPVVVLCGYEAVKEALVDHAEAFGGRGPLLALDDSIRDYGVVFSNGERWRQMRRFSLAALRDFGMGKRSIEERIQEEAQFLVEALKRTEERLFDPTFHISHAVSNVICSVVFGQRFEYEDREFLALLSLINQTFQLLFSTWVQLVNFFPRLMQTLPGPHHQLSVNIKGLLRFIRQKTKTHREAFDPNCPRDFIDCFLTKMEQERGNPASEFREENLTITVLNLFFGGTESVSTTLRCGLLILLRHPEIEAKVQEEIDRVIGRNRSPCMEDRSRMPYTDAVVHEIQRFADVSPLGVPHVTTSNVQFRGYTIPKGTTVMPLLTTVLHDPLHFETPRKFNPGHFLDENGAFKKNEAFLPFSTGKRVCLGEGLARMELFLYFTTLLQNFSLKPLQDNSREINSLPEMWLGGRRRLAGPYQLRVVAR